MCPMPEITGISISKSTGRSSVQSRQRDEWCTRCKSRSHLGRHVEGYLGDVLILTERS